jgi:hypothetical protein
MTFVFLAFYMLETTLLSQEHKPTLFWKVDIYYVKEKLSLPPSL